jgi:hypothetical protein
MTTNRFAVIASYDNLRSHAVAQGDGELDLIDAA